MKKYILTFLCVTLSFTSCVNEDVNIDTKKPTKVPGYGLLTNANKNLFDLMQSTSQSLNVFRLYSQYFSQTTYPDESQYNQVTRNIGGGMWNRLYRDILQDLKGAEEAFKAEAKADPLLKNNLPNKLALVEILRVYSYATLVDIFGNVPYSESLDSENPSPKYDDAATIYQDLMSRLDTAINNFSGSSIDDIEDSVYQGNAILWKKAAISLKLRLAMRLADVDPSTSKTKAEEAIRADLILNNADNFGITYYSTSPSTNPLWVSLVQSGRNDFIPSNTIVDVMNEVNDPRLNKYFAAMENGTYKGGVYGSANAASSFSQLSALLKDPTLKGYLITASEVNFLLAEAKARGYDTPKSIEEYYNEGIKQSILEWGGTEAEVTSYLAESSVSYSTATGNWKQKIATQKWIAMFNNGFEGWTTWRIFDYPQLNVPEGLSYSDIPTRFLYPTSEAQLNGANLKEAATAIGGDSKKTKLFWDKN